MAATLLSWHLIDLNSSEIGKLKHVMRSSVLVMVYNLQEQISYVNLSFCTYNPYPKPDKSVALNSRQPLSKP